MTCISARPKFRLLDAIVGWDEDPGQGGAQGLDGLTDLGGLTLARIVQHPDASVFGQALPPAWLARGCGPCEWYLATCCPPRSRVLRLSPCHEGWQPVWTSRCAPKALRCAVAIAVHCDRFAVADSETKSVSVWRRRGSELLFTLPIGEPGPIAAGPHGEWLIVDNATMQLRIFDPSGAEHPQRNVTLPGHADRIGVDTDCRIWLVTHGAQGFELWMSAGIGAPFEPAMLDALLDAFADTRLRRAVGRTFCMELDGAAGRELRCYDCYGREVPMPAPGPQSAVYATHGQLLTLALDSGVPRCRWHRVRLDADVPLATTLKLALATQEEASPVPQGATVLPEWQGFASGVPHPQDWQEAPGGALDFLVDQPPGRYLFVRIRLTGDGFTTPTLRRVRLDFPRQTSLESLPAVYRENPQAEEFTERFLSLFDAAVEEIDQAITRYPALLDADGVPGEVLPWLGSFFDVVMDPAWSADQRRAVLNGLPELYRRRGTVEGLRRTLELLFDVDPVIQEAALERLWGAVGESALGAVRLFSPASSRMRLGSSALSQAPVRSYGDPNLDPLTAQAFRFRVLFPATTDSALAQQMEQVVATQKPAHTLANVARGDEGFIVGPSSRVGIDTAFVPLPAPVLGESSDSVRLGRRSVLWSGLGCIEPTLQIGQTSVVGINTVME